MAKEDDLRDTLNAAAQQIARTQSNPRSWQSWMVYLLGQLEDAAGKDPLAAEGSFNEMLRALQDAIRNRLNTGGW
jgi:hypothetical protein